MVVTGLGAVTPVGLTAADTWSALLAGQSGVGPITLFDASQLEVRIGAEVKGFRPEQHIPPKELRHLDRSTQFAWVTAREALADAGLELPLEDPARLGVVCGSGAGAIERLIHQHEALLTRGPDRVLPTFLAHFMVASAPGVLAAQVGARGPTLGLSTACASGTHAIGEASWAIARGDADVMLAAGTEACLLPVLLAGFINMGALSRRNDAPARASRPFDAQRDGFVIGEGATTLVLEELAHARARAARIYCEVLGYASGNDAYHMVQPREQGAGAEQVMRQALASAGRQAGVAPTDVGYVNAHGTSTPVNDRLETLAIKRVFGTHASRLAVSSTKSTTGHLLGAAGALEGLACALALHTGWLPPTVNLDTPDPACDLDYVPHVARRWEPAVALSNSFGLGGHNATLVFGVAP